MSRKNARMGTKTKAARQEKVAKYYKMFRGGNNRHVITSLRPREPRQTEDRVIASMRH